MPKRTDIASILIIGAGPIVIGQACEFDYSGAQACKALKAEGYRVVLVNSNPATIMTDPELADATYIEPITPEMVEQDHREGTAGRAAADHGRADGAQLSPWRCESSGVLEKYGVELIGASADAIDKAEDRELFREAMDKIGLESPRSHQVTVARRGAGGARCRSACPPIIRPSFTLGGTGGGIAYNREEFIEIVERGLDPSPTNEVLIEESVLGWKEFEMEVVRDKADNCIIVCSIENVDPMGVHTGDSITVAPALTLTDKEYQRMRDASIAVLREIGVETGGSNVQFAVNPAGRPHGGDRDEPARVALLGAGLQGHRLSHRQGRREAGRRLHAGRDCTTTSPAATPASFEPTIDYVVTKIPRFAFEKFPGAEPMLTTSMKSVGEAMAIGRTFQEALQKALRSLETGLTGLDEIAIEGLGQGRRPQRDPRRAGTPTPDRLLVSPQALRYGLGGRGDPRGLQDTIRGSWAEIERHRRAKTEIRANGLPTTTGAAAAAQGAGLLRRAPRARSPATRRRGR